MCSCINPGVLLLTCISIAKIVCRDAVRGDLAAAASSFASSNLLLCSLKVPSAAVHSSFCSQVKHVVQGDWDQRWGGDGRGGVVGC